MKKIFYFIASAIVALGAMACQNDIDENINTNTPSDGLSITVEVGEMTRVDLVKNEENKWCLAWEGNEKLIISNPAGLDPDNVFVNSPENPNVFKSTTANLNVGDLVRVLKVNHDFDSGATYTNLNSSKGADGFALKNEAPAGAIQETIPFDPSTPIKLYTEDNALHFSSDYDVKLVATVTDPTEKIFCPNNSTFTNEIEIAAGDDLWVVFKGHTNATLTYSLKVDGEWVESGRTTPDLRATRTIFNLGHLEKPAPQKYKVYVIAQPKSTQAAWTKVNFYTWDVDPIAAWPGTDITNQKETINGYTYNYYEYPETWTGKNVKVIINNGASQTSNIELGTLDKNYYVVYNDEGTVYTEAPAAGSIKEAAPQSSMWALAGDFNSWGDKAMEVVAGETELFVAKNVSIGAYKEIKVKEKGNWNNSYGGGINYLNQNIWTKVYSDGANFSVVNADTYDVYFDKANTRLYLMKAGTDYKTAKEQSTNGAAPDLSGASWGLCGTHNNWNSPDIQLVWDGTISLYVAKSAKLTGEFKVRANNTWGEDYGCGGTITVNASAGKAMSRGGGNCKVASGTYDVYFDFAGKKIWVKTPGSAAPTK